MKQLLSAYQYTSARSKGEGLRIGVARHVPRGIRREDWQRLGYFDLWVPLLAPPAELVKRYRGEEISFASFSRHYRAELKKKESWQVVELLAGISLFMPISLGCFCEDESRCHRSILKEIVSKAAEVKSGAFSKQSPLIDIAEVRKFASPVCFADEIER